jgi:hypothetical protein
MLCIFCCEEREPSEEHVFPLAIGGTVVTYRVCKPCNDTLGARVDSALCDFLPVRTRRAQLGLAGNSGEVPLLHESLLGVAEIVGPGGGRIQTSLDESTGKLKHRLLPHGVDVTSPDGRKDRQITVGIEDKAQIPLIVQRERNRLGLPPLSEDKLRELIAKNLTINTIENPLIKKSIRVNFDYVNHAMAKIAYELAFLWLGEEYLSDPMAAELRAAICDPDPASTDRLAGAFELAEESAAFRSWTRAEAHHLAYAIQGLPLPTGREIVIAVRIFDIYAARVVVTRRSDRYIKTAADLDKLRFLAIDAATGAKVDTAFGEEVRRMASARRPPPFPDPLCPGAT